jgi:hypothetical protein
MYVNEADKALGFVDNAGLPQDLLAVRHYSDAATYVVGDYAIDPATLLVYRCATAITTPETFDKTKWDVLHTFKVIRTWCENNYLVQMGTTAPANPIKGQLWADTSEQGQPYYYDGSNWVELNRVVADANFLMFKFMVTLQVNPSTGKADPDDPLGGDPFDTVTGALDWITTRFMVVLCRINVSAGNCYEPSGGTYIVSPQCIGQLVITGQGRGTTYVRTFRAYSFYVVEDLQLIDLTWENQSTGTGVRTIDVGGNGGLRLDNVDIICNNAVTPSEFALVKCGFLRFHNHVTLSDRNPGNNPVNGLATVECQGFTVVSGATKLSITSVRSSGIAMRVMGPIMSSCGTPINFETPGSAKVLQMNHGATMDRSLSAIVPANGMKWDMVGLSHLEVTDANQDKGYILFNDSFAQIKMGWIKNFNNVTTSPGTGICDVVFDKPFPNMCSAVFASIDASDVASFPAALTASIVVGNKTNAGFKVAVKTIQSGGNVAPASPKIYWMAIGL